MAGDVISSSKVQLGEEQMLGEEEKKEAGLEEEWKKRARLNGKKTGNSCFAEQLAAFSGVSQVKAR